MTLAEKRSIQSLIRNKKARISMSSNPAAKIFYAKQIRSLKAHIIAGSSPLERG